MDKQRGQCRLQKSYRSTFPPNQYLAFLCYRATQFPCSGLSPAELLVGCLHSDVLQVKETLTPIWRHVREFKDLDKKV